MGFEASAYPTTGTRGFRGIRQDPPHVILIDLVRMPSYGRAMGVLLRQQKQLGLIPLVFVEGDPEKAAKVRATLPDAMYTRGRRSMRRFARRLRRRRGLRWCRGAGESRG